MIADKVSESVGPTVLVERDISPGLPVLTRNWIEANFTKDRDRTSEQRDILAFSDQLLEQLKQADILLIGMPVYNFAIPATLKSWIDLICRPGKSFSYTDRGPVGLLDKTRAFVCVTSGSVTIGSEADFVTPYLRQILGFIGISDVTFIPATGLARGQDKALAFAQDKIARLEF